MTDSDRSFDMLRAQLNGETSRLPWSELLRFFASGSVFAVSSALDLVDVAARIASDDKRAVAAWLEQGQLARVSDSQATGWLETNASLWTVVVKPWILVQDKQDSAAPATAMLH